MQLRFRHLIAVWLFLCTFRPSEADPKALPPPVVPQCVGVNIHITGQPKQDLDGLAHGGFGWIRMDFAWDTVEKTKGVYDFSAYDSLLTGLTVRHIKPLFILDYGNDLYQKGAPRTPEARSAFTRFAAAAVRHYHGKTIIWEIWNEPNGSFWQPQANVEEYGTLALETARAIRAADPNATVVAPGTSGLPMDFMEALFKRGLLNVIDAVSFHPYRGSSPETAASDYQMLRLLIHRYAPGRDVPLVSSEWGYTTVSVTQEQQAQYLVRQWLFNLAEGLRLSIWYDWHDDGLDPKNGEHHFGTVYNDYSPKPTFQAAQTLTRTLGGLRFIKRIPLASPDDYLLLFARGDTLKLAAWTTQSDHSLTLPLSTVTRITAMLGAQTEPTIQQGRLHLSLSASPVYVEVPSRAALQQAAAWTAVAVDPMYQTNQPLRVAITYRNPDAISHRVRFPMSLLSANGAIIPIPGDEDIVGPHQVLSEGKVSPALARVSARARVGLIVDGVRQPYPQDVNFTPTDPLTLSVAPFSLNKISILIANPEGTPFTGRLNALGTSLPLRLAAGQTTLTVLTDGSVGATWRLRDSQGRMVAEQPGRRFVPYSVTPPLELALDGDLKVPSSAQRQSDKVAQAVRYRFAPGWSFWRMGETHPTPLPGRPDFYGIWMNGDGSGNNVNIRFDDATGQTFQASGPMVNWIGQRYVTFPLRPGPNVGHWGGANDGQIHYPIRLTTLLLLDSRAEAHRHWGVIRWRDPDIIYGLAKP